MAYAHKDLQAAPLAVLAHRINQHQETINGYTRNALQVALDQGDVLRWAKARIGKRKWKSWREQNCPKVAERTDALHRRLAAHRDFIELKLKENPDLTLTEAVKLISTPKAPKPNVSKRTVAVDQKVIVENTPTSTTSIETATATQAEAKPTTPVIIANPRAPTVPMGDAIREAIIGLAGRALSVLRRPASAPNNEVAQKLLENIIDEAKTVREPSKPPVLDMTLFNKAMNLAA
jgi:hypothetical protein